MIHPRASEVTQLLDKEQNESFRKEQIENLDDKSKHTASCCFFKINGFGNSIQGTATPARSKSTSCYKEQNM
jgi:hypothetical protein